MSRQSAASTSSSLVCNICNRSFSRAEHRNRHMATHNVLRPYRCNFCDQQFQRIDTLQRHVDKHCSSNSHRLHGSNESRSRVKLACDTCHSKKLRCDGKEPCSKCAAKRRSCTYQRPTSLRLPDSPQCDPPATQGNSNLGDAEHPPADPSEPSLEQQTTVEAVAISSQRPDHPTTHQSLLQVGPNQFSIPDGSQLSDAIEVDMANSDFAAFDSIFDWDHNPFFVGPADADTPFFPALDADFFRLDYIMLSSPKYIGYSDTELSHFADLVDLEGSGTQFDDQAARWLRMPLIPRRYDLNMLNSLLRLFIKFVAGTFTSFHGFSITAQTLPEQIIAMAAVGSLFVNVKGSSRIARMLFSDGNRMLHNFVGGFHKYSKPVALSLVQAFLASALFGICGGHPRSCELSEANHGAMVQAIYLYDLFSPDNLPDPEDQSRRERLLADLFLLEAYRVSLFQLKPILTPAVFANQVSQGGVQQQHPPHGEDWVKGFLTRQTQAVLHPGQPESPPRLEVHRVALITIASWFASGQWIGNAYEAVDRQWKPDIIRQSVDTYAQTLSEQRDASGIILAYMSIVSLHAPLADINEAAYAVTTQSPLSGELAESLNNWRRSFDVDKALENASLLLEAAVGILTPADTTSTYLEAPHDALCIFNAALVIWASKSAGITSSREAPVIPEMTKAAVTLMHLQASAAKTLSQVLLTI